MTESEPDDKTLVFDRTPMAKLISCAATFGSAALLFDYLSRGRENINVMPLVGFGLLLVGTFLSALLQYGDHIYINSRGVLYRNRLLPILGREGRWLSWDDIVEVREIRRKILVLLSRNGEKILVDAVAGYPIARREILERIPHARKSGTLLMKEDE